MATALQNNGMINSEIPDGSSFRVGLVVAEWNRDITLNLEKGALEILAKSGIKSENLYHIQVPGSYELISGAQMLLENKVIDTVICLGCVIRGETAHFDFICSAVSQGLASLNIQYIKPIIFGVLTTENLKQAQERAGGSLGNKGEEAALTALKMVHLKSQIVKNKSNITGFL